MIFDSNFKLLMFFLSIILSFIISFGVIKLFRLLFEKEYNKEYKTKKYKKHIIFVNDIERKIFLLSFLFFLYLIFKMFSLENIILKIFIVFTLFFISFNLSIKLINFLFNNFFNVDFRKDVYIGYSKIGKIMKFLFKTVVISFLILTLLMIFKIDFEHLYQVSFLKHILNFLFVILVDSVFVLLGFFFYNIVKKVLSVYAEKTKIRLDNFIYKMLETPLIFMFVFLGLKFSFSFLDVSAKLMNNVNFISNFAIIIFVIILIFRIIDESYSELMLSRKKKNMEHNYGEELGPLIKGVIKVIVFFIGFIIILDYLGINVSSLIAGLGIGGIAVALAAQDTLSNFFGSISIFSDKPFKIGDRILVLGYDGIIQEVGVRSTKIRLLSGNVVSIPNSLLSKSSIENISQRENIKEVATIRLTYSTSSYDIKKGVNIIKEILKEYEENGKLKEDSIVFFDKMGDYSLNITVIFWILELDWLKAMLIKEEIYHRIYQRFNEEKLEFAFLSQTIYVKND
ncbi:MAG: mechanosensitive ion channel family protein [Candidatus Nanoarchaeia archaeon]|nr:mechanosensitive ion channel family protein [Candidatus Nanoarchaeia archaeon]